MGAILPEPESLERFARNVPDGERIVMLNLLRYRQRADVQGEEITGRQCYERYERAVLPFLSAVGGRPIWRGKVGDCVIAPPGEHWDDALLVEYPSRGAFERMVADPGYQAIMGLRTAALDDSRLIATRAPQHIGRLGWWLFKLFAARRDAR